MTRIDQQRSRFFTLRVALALIVSLLALPYLVDVGYMEDQTPTHSAQETLSDKDDIGDGDIFLVLGFDQDHAVVVESTDLQPSPSSFRPDNLQDRTVPAVEYLSIASLISRPPPSV